MALERLEKSSNMGVLLASDLTIRSGSQKPEITARKKTTLLTSSF
jgi:hypothetical protein